MKCSILKTKGTQTTANLPMRNPTERSNRKSKQLNNDKDYLKNPVLGTHAIIQTIKQQLALSNFPNNRSH